MSLRTLNTVRHRLNLVWRYHHFDTVFLLLCSFGCLYWRFHVPSPGKAVAALAFVAAIMSFRQDLGGSSPFTDVRGCKATRPACWRMAARSQPGTGRRAREVRWVPRL